MSGAGPCPWCGDDPLYRAYHDEEWGRPTLSGRALWEKLVLDGFQAGLSWLTILRKRENFRAAFEGFDPHRIALWGEPEVARLLADPGIVRSRAKIEAAIANARAYERIEAREGFSEVCWRAVGHRVLDRVPARPEDVPAETAESRALSKALKAEGVKFAGPVIVYAFMQASGLVNDHLAACPARPACEAEARGLGLA